MTTSVRIALLGLGEAGSTLARDLVAAGEDVRGYDPQVADLVLSVNSSRDAVPALVNALPRSVFYKGLPAAAEQVTELGVRSRIAAAARDQLVELRDRTNDHAGRRT